LHTSDAAGTMFTLELLPCRRYRNSRESKAKLNFLHSAGCWEQSVHIRIRLPVADRSSSAVGSYGYM